MNATTVLSRSGLCKSAISDHGQSNDCVSFFSVSFFFSFGGLGSVRMVKNCDLGHSFPLYGPPSRQITYI